MKIILFVTFISMGLSCSQSAADPLDKGDNMMSENHSTFSKATFGSGCFWCSEAIFSRLTGVHHVVSGYSGGHTKNPSYEAVVSGTTGHAEVIQVTYDPGVISYLQLLEVFFKTHDPTTLNRQGADIGTQYRSVIFYHDEAQKSMAQKVRERLNQEGIWDDPIVTGISLLESFYEAEKYHHDYFERNPDQGYCQLVIVPKVKIFEKMFDDLLKQ